MNAASRPVARRGLTAVMTAAVWLTALVPFASAGFRCPMAALTHHPCPGCGMTRACLRLLSGDVRGSLAMHPLAVPTAATQLALAVGTVVAAYAYGAPWKMFERRWGRVLLGAVVAVLAADFALWVARAAGAFGGPVPV